MYSTCLYCSGDLGRNDVIEHLQVGARLAFDTSRGRLWVICWLCARWNLVPFDTRLEAIDECERQFRSTSARYSTDQIGMARISDALDLIRIGEPLRPEFAAWRYGRIARRSNFGARRLREAWRASGGGVAGLVSDTLEGLGRLLALPLFDAQVRPGVALARHRVVRDPWTKHLIPVPVAAMMHSTLIIDESTNWQLELPYRTEIDHLLGVSPLMLSSIHDHHGVGLFKGDELVPALGQTIPIFEYHRPSAAQTNEATRLLERVGGDAGKLLPYVVGKPLHMSTARRFPLADVAPELRLALEMTAHEETERRAMAGELKLLEREWRAAEELAGIADNLAADGV